MTAEPCAWCGEPAVTTLVVTPAEYETVQRVTEVKGQQVRQAVRRLRRAEITADACAAHAHPEQVDQLTSKRQHREEAKAWAERQITID